MLGLATVRDFARERRERTRRLIELGQLVRRSGLDELVGDDDAVLLGALLELADQLREQADERRDEDETASGAGLLSRWRERGLRAFAEATERDGAA